MSEIPREEMGGDLMIVKQPDDRSSDIAQLEKLLETAPVERRSQVAAELRTLRAGTKGEKESTYFIDFDYGSSNNWVIIHDLRLEINGRVAQIDHLMINRMLHVFVLETKHFHAGVKITDEGEFLRWNSYNKTYEGMPSPLAQNERHITVLKEALSSIEMPTRMGMRLSLTYQPYVLVAPNARIVRPKKFDTSRVIKADALSKTIDSYFNSFGVLGAFGSLSKVVSLETIEAVANRLVSLHRPVHYDYAAKLNVRKVEPSSGETETERARNIQAHLCRACGRQDLSILHGKYGYYFKCRSCGGNTPIKLGCGQTGHKERLRKDGYRFFRECADCGTSMLFYVNRQDS